MNPQNSADFSFPRVITPGWRKARRLCVQASEMGYQNASPSPLAMSRRHNAGAVASCVRCASGAVIAIEEGRLPFRVC
jgi:hypothetical protein